MSTGDREVLNSIQGVFFVALANSAERDLTVKPVASKPSEGVFTVTNKHTLRGPVPTKQSPQLQQQHQRHRTAEKHSENSVKEKFQLQIIKLSIILTLLKNMKNNLIRVL